MAWIEWLEASAIAEWVRSSALGWPLMLSLHSLGMGVMVGLLLIVSARLLGYLPALPVPLLRATFPIMWAGFALSLVAGSALFLSRATSYSVNLTFILKMTAILLGAFLGVGLRHRLEQQPTALPARPWPMLAATSIVVWLFAIAAGRLTAYL